MFDTIENKKDERTESVFVYVTPQVRKEFELARDNKSLQDEIIRKHIKSETNWLKQEMSEIDEMTLKYRAKLLTIKDNFQEAQNSYVEQIEGIYKVAEKSFKKIDNVSDLLDKKVETTYNKVKQLSESISYINSDRLEKLLDVVDRFSKMSDEEKSLIESIINKK